MTAGTRPPERGGMDELDRSGKRRHVRGGACPVREGAGRLMMPAGRHGPDPSTGMARGLRAAGWILTVLYACGVGKSLMYLRFGWDDDVLPVDYVNLALVTANTLVWIVLAWRHRGR